MLGDLKSGTDAQSFRCADAKRLDVHGPRRPVRCLAPGEILFETGEPNGEIYRVESGSLCHYIRWQRGHHAIIEFLFPGSILGFGHIATHVSTAKAMLPSTISIVTPQEFEHALQVDDQLAARFTAAGDREFDYLRFRAMEAVRYNPTQRLASFLAALSRISACEGRDATLIADEICSSAVAERLVISIDGLAAALGHLEARGLVRRSETGLRIIDIAALERFADAAPSQDPHSKLEMSAP